MTYQCCSRCDEIEAVFKLAPMWWSLSSHSRMISCLYKLPKVLFKGCSWS